MEVDFIRTPRVRQRVNFTNGNLFQNFKAQNTTLIPQNPQPPVSVQKPRLAKDTLNIIPDSYADEAIAAVALVGVLAFGTRSISKLKNLVTGLTSANKTLNDTVQSFQGKMQGIMKLPDGVDAQKAQSVIADLANGKFASADTVKGVVDTAQHAVNQANNAMNLAAHTSATGYVSCNIMTENVNGVNLSLASLFRPVAKDTPAMKAMHDELHVQSALSILGLRKPPKPVDDPFVRIVSVELKPFTSVGGLASVPKEIAEELPKIVNKKNGARFMLDTPMYTGTIAPGKHAALLKTEDGGFIYRISQDANPKDAKDYPVRLLDEFEVPIFGERPQKVKLYQFSTDDFLPKDKKAIDDLRKPFTEELRSLFSKEQLAEIDAAVNKDGVYIADGYKIEKLESGEWVFRPRVTYNLWQNEKFNLDVPTTAQSRNNYTSDAESSDELERFTFFCKYIYEHTLGLFKTRKGGRIFTPGVPKTGDTPAIPPKAIFGADAFILNDWHTGPLAAMMRLATVAKKHQQNLDAEIVEKVANMPIMSILHNTYDTGRNGDSARISRFFNIMFEKNAASVVPHAYMPNVSVNNEGGLTSNLWNGLMQGGEMSPLKMLATYSDTMHPVSTGYADECVKFVALGHDLQPLYKLRAKVDMDIRKLQTIMDNNGIKADGISTEQILRPTFFGITNGSNKAEHILNSGKIADVMNAFYAPIAKNDPSAVKPVLRAFNEALTTDPKKAFEWKMYNKGQILELYKGEIAKAQKAGGSYWDSSIPQDKRDWSELHVWLGKMTSLEGVTVKTPFLTSSGRITEQKGYETFMSAIRKYYMSLGHDVAKKEPPVFMIQGEVTYDSYAQGIVKCVEKTKKFLLDEADRRAAQNLHEEAEALRTAAKRIVFLDRGDGGKYDATKILTDINIMSSNYEPCGLTHKQFGATSGGITVGNKTGGIPSGLDGEKSKCFIGVDFDPAMGDPKEALKLDPDFEIRGGKFAEGIKTAISRWEDQLAGRNDEFAQGVAETLAKDFTWAKEGNSGFQYVDALRKLGALPLKEAA